MLFESDYDVCLAVVLAGATARAAVGAQCAGSVSGQGKGTMFSGHKTPIPGLVRDWSRDWSGIGLKYGLVHQKGSRNHQILSFEGSRGNQQLY